MLNTNPLAVLAPTITTTTTVTSTVTSSAAATAAATVLPSSTLLSTSPTTTTTTLLFSTSTFVASAIITSLSDSSETSHLTPFTYPSPSHLTPFTYPSPPSSSSSSSGWPMNLHPLPLLHRHLLSTCLPTSATMRTMVIAMGGNLENVGLGIWIASVFFCGSLCFGNIGRRLSF